MRSVKMNKTELLAIVRENKTKHITEYEEAVTDYKALAIKLAKENLKLAKSGDLEKIKEVKAMLAAPVSYENDYNRATRMLELSVEDVIELEDDVFNQLVLDEWRWKQVFSLSNSTYKMMM